MAIKKKSAVKRMSNKASYGDEPLYFDGMPADDFGRKIALADSLTYYGKINKRSDHYPMVYLYAKDKFSKEEKMLMLSKEIIYLLKRANKYYLASDINPNNPTHYENMKQAIKDINSRLIIMNSYNYPIKLDNKLNEINDIWNRDKEFFYQVEELSIPYILSESTEYMEDLLIRMEQYHKKNL
jgi:hypothetical protein